MHLELSTFEFAYSKSESKLLWWLAICELYFNSAGMWLLIDASLQTFQGILEARCRTAVFFERAMPSILAVVSDEVPLVASRQLLQQFAVSLPLLQPEVHKLVAKHALTKIQPRVVSFEEQVKNNVYSRICHIYSEQPANLIVNFVRMDFYSYTSARVSLYILKSF